MLLIVVVDVVLSVSIDSIRTTTRSRDRHIRHTHGKALPQVCVQQAMAVTCDDNLDQLIVETSS